LEKSAWKIGKGEIIMNYTCIVCGFNELDEPPYYESGNPSDEICPCCGIQFGYDDFDAQDKQVFYEQWRNKWILDGCQWFSKGWNPPENWNAKQQINNLINS
jgi:hypothetical protein